MQIERLVLAHLGLGMAFTGADRSAWQLRSGSLANVLPGNELFQAYSSLLYFSFVTLTSVGYGDIVPVQAFVRALSNLEAIIGQLCPATLLARLVTLELERRRPPRWHGARPEKGEAMTETEQDRLLIAITARERGSLGVAV